MPENTRDAPVPAVEIICQGCVPLSRIIAKEIYTHPDRKRKLKSSFHFAVVLRICIPWILPFSIQRDPRER
jgi:hypothetical protein